LDLGQPVVRVRLPDLRMAGRWREEGGFGLGQEFEVEVKAGRLTIQEV
jgi:hypothetical protein